MKANSVDELLRYLDGVVTVDREIVTVRDEPTLREKIDGLVQTAVFGEGLVRDTARWLIWEIAQGLGIYRLRSINYTWPSAAAMCRPISPFRP